jgi:transformation/transcription domain-associated protein
MSFYSFSCKVVIRDIICPIIELCHIHNELSQNIWIQMFPQIFSLLNSKQKQNICSEISPFISSSSHSTQKQSNSSAISTFIESIPFSFSSVQNSHNNIFIRPSLLTFLAKNHNLWHRCLIFLENLLFLTSSQNNRISEDLHLNQNEAFSSLSKLYSMLKEDDYRVGLWQLKAIHDNTKLALIYDQHGLYYQEQKLLEDMISKSIDIYLNETVGPNQVDELLEYNIWEEKWIDCCKELNQWNELYEYAIIKGNDLSLNLECLWKSQQHKLDWQSFKSILLMQKDQNIPKENLIRWSLFQGYYLICNQDDYHHNIILTNANTSNILNPNGLVESRVDRLIYLSLKEWRRLPKLLTPAHIPLLQLSQQIIELQEAFQIQNGIYSLSQSNSSTQQNIQINQSAVLQEIKGKTTFKKHVLNSYFKFYDSQCPSSSSGHRRS